MKTSALAKGAGLGAALGLATGVAWFAAGFATDGKGPLAVPPWGDLVCTSSAGDGPINSCFGRTYVAVPLLLGALVGVAVAAARGA